MDIVDGDSSDFIVTSPDLQVGLSIEIEHGTKPKEYLNRYHSEYDVRCAFCVGHTPHRRGFTVRMEDGRTALCGIDCAKEFFGEEIALRFAQDLQQQIDAFSRRKVLSRTVEGAPAALRALNEDWIETEKAFASAVRGLELWVDAESFERHLTDDALVLKNHRTFYVDTVDRNGRAIKKKETIEEVKARIPGARCLMLGVTCMREAKGGLASLAGWAQRPEMIMGNAVDELMKKREITIHLIEDALRFAQLSHSFFQKVNMERFVTWHRRTYRGDHPNIELTPDNLLTISHPEPNGPPTIVYLPKGLPDHKRLVEPLKGRQ